MFGRVLVAKPGDLPHPMRAGEGMLANFSIYENAADAVLTLTADILSGGKVVQTTTLTAARNFTTDTAANLLAAFTGMDVGDAISFVVVNSQAAAFNVVAVGGVGVTLKGVGNVIPGTSRVFTLVCTSKTAGAEAFDLW